MKIINFIIGVVILILPSGIIGQETISPSPNDPIINIGQSTLYYLDSEFLNIEDILDQSIQSQFRKTNQEVPNFSSTNESAWLKFKINPIEEGNYYLEVGSPFIDSISFYSIDDTGVELRGVAGDEVRFDAREIQVSTFFFKLNPTRDKPTTYYLRVNSLQPLFFPIRVGTLKSFMEDAHKLDFIQGIYIGLMVLIFLYNLFLYFSTRESVYLYYIAYVFSITLFMSFIYQHAFEYIWPNTPIINRYAVLSASMTILTAVFFTQRFLRTKEVVPKWHNVSFVFIGSAILIAILLFTPYKIIALQISQGTIFLMAIFFLALGIIVLRKGNKTAMFYLVAWVFLIIGLIMGILESVNLLQGLYYINYMQIGSAIEVVLLSLALADQINLFKREKQEAQALSLKAAEENAMLVKKQNIDLELKVNERTEELSRTLELVEIERAKSDKLLLNILPIETAKELKETGRAAPRDYEQVSVLFTDIVGFTKIAKMMPASELVVILDEIFQAFDLIVRRNGLEKIKTIGDAYMAAGGIPIENKSHPQDTVRAAIEMLAFIETRKADHKATALDIRIGIHTGSVAAGVVGMDKFAYDIWGPTVNLAARMEQSGETGRINISSYTYNIVKDLGLYSFEPRGEIKVKGDNSVEMFFVNS